MKGTIILEIDNDVITSVLGKTEMKPFTRFFMSEKQNRDLMKLLREITSDTLTSIVHRFKDQSHLGPLGEMTL